MLIDVPAHVKHEGHVQNSITVQGGSNWDLSRSAVPTPISEIGPVKTESSLPKTQYHPVHEMPSHAPDSVVRFTNGGAVLSSAERRTLQGFKRGQEVVIAGHADKSEKNSDSVSKRRAEAVARQLKAQGVKIADVRYFGGTTPQAWDGDAAINRRVEVFIK